MGADHHGVDRREGGQQDEARGHRRDQGPPATQPQRHSQAWHARTPGYRGYGCDRHGGCWRLALAWPSRSRPCRHGARPNHLSANCGPRSDCQMDRVDERAGSGSGRGMSRAPPPRPLLAGGRCALAAFGPTRGELAAHRGPLSTGRTVPPCPWPCSTQMQAHAAAAPESRRSPAPTHWSWHGHPGHDYPPKYGWDRDPVDHWPVGVARRRSQSSPRKGPIEGTWERRHACQHFAKPISASTACRPGVFFAQPPPRHQHFTRRPATARQRPRRSPSPRRSAPHKRQRVHHRPR